MYFPPTTVLVTRVLERFAATTLDETQEPQDRGKTPRRVVGVGSVGRTLGEASYVLYNPGTNVVTFKMVNTHDFSDLHQRSTPVL